MRRGRKSRFGLLRCKLNTRRYSCFDILTIYRSVVHLSIITATIPRINSFIADVQTRQAGLALTQKDYDSYVHGKSGGSHQRSKDGSKNWSRKDNNSRSGGVLSSFRPDNTVEQRNECRGRGDEIELDVRDNIETGSQSSLSRYVLLNARMHFFAAHGAKPFPLTPTDTDPTGTQCIRRRSSSGKKSTRRIGDSELHIPCHGRRLTVLLRVPRLYMNKSHLRHNDSVYYPERRNVLYISHSSAEIIHCVRERETNIVASSSKNHKYSPVQPHPK